VAPLLEPAEAGFLFMDGFQVFLQNHQRQGGIFVLIFSVT
jgi:hypothetical protein